MNRANRALFILIGLILALLRALPAFASPGPPVSPPHWFQAHLQIATAQQPLDFSVRQSNNTIEVWNGSTTPLYILVLSQNTTLINSPATQALSVRPPQDFGVYGKIVSNQLYILTSDRNDWQISDGTHIVFNANDIFCFAANLKKSQ